ncbi:MAG: DUF1064 domain-containing protein [Fibrobacter sp.]|nr:DUF1064 domain-containing protein [Fibrobacter sp.]
MKRRQKYNARRTTLQGITFDSKKEAQRYIYLRELEQQGIINNLHRQVTYTLLPAITQTTTQQLKTKTRTTTRTIQRAITYRADFVYCKDGRIVTEDVKASPKMIPADFKLKQKLFFARHRYHISLIFHPEQPP